ncbi:MAG: hypothetical protein H5T41_11210, partial [Methanomassiliicoccales archaeon]|nr:hypothetical protein [Methanomassiliicoccales archaeon]
MKSKAFFLVSLALLVGSVVFAECPSVLIILNGSSWSELATTLLTQCLTEGGAQVTFAERAREVSQQYVVQFYEVLENTRSGKMRFHNELKASNLSETQLRQSYRGILESAERLRADRGEIAYGSKYMGSQQYSEFQRQTGYLVVDYGEEVEYSDWYDKLVTQQEQRAFWQTVYSWNADIIIFASLDIINLGQYGGIYTCRGVMSLRAVDVRLERPVVLKSFAVVANGVELSPEAAAQRIVDSLVKRCAKELDGVIPCYKYFDPPTPDIPLGAIGVAVVDVKAPGYQQEVGDSIRRMVEAAMLKHTEFAIYT